MRPVMANLGFILQMAGLFMLIPIIVAFLSNETDILISFFITSVAFMSYGFLMNSLAEKKILNLKSSCILIFLSFLFLGVIGSIPYFYTNSFNDTDYVQRFTNGFFESISGFTTTGFSLFNENVTLSDSLLVYRSFTELIGGVGIVFILLAFFYPSKALESFSQVIGVDKIDGNLKKIYFSVLLIYSFFILVFILAFFIFGFQNVTTTGTFIVDTITGGFQPSAGKLMQYIVVPVKYFIVILMFLGSINFTFHYKIFSRKWKEAITTEILVYIIIIVVATLLIIDITNLGWFDSLFHVVSMSSETGYDYVNIVHYNDTVSAILIALILIGACGFSMAGGIRIYRIMTFFKSIGIGVRKILGKEVGIDVKSEGLSDTEIIYNNISILIFVGVVFVSAILFSTAGVSFFDSLFDVSSAIATNGISTGAVNISLAVQYKWLIIALMFFGRVEIIPLFLAFGSYPKTDQVKGRKDRLDKEYWDYLKSMVKRKLKKTTVISTSERRLRAG